MSDPSLSLLLKANFAELSDEIRSNLVRFYEFLLEENRRQNLTRLTSPEDFVFGNVLDVLELLKLNWIVYPALDLGSGAGIPGLLAALIDRQRWILVESEQRKAEYLSRAVKYLELEKSVTIIPDRVEKYLQSEGHKGSVVVRAVASVEKIYRWIFKCSTWNNLILFKGPNWEKEWEEFKKTKFKNELKIVSDHSYTVGPEKKSRILVQLK